MKFLTFGIIAGVGVLAQPESSGAGSDENSAVRSNPCNISVAFGEYDKAELSDSRASFNDVQAKLQGVFSVLESLSEKEKNQCDDAMIDINLSTARHLTCLSLFSYTYNHATINTFKEQITQINICLAKHKKATVAALGHEAVSTIIRTSRPIPIDLEATKQRVNRLEIELSDEKAGNFYVALKIDSHKKLYGLNELVNARVRSWHQWMYDEPSQTELTGTDELQDLLKVAEAEHLKWFLGMPSKYHQTMNMYPSRDVMNTNDDLIPSPSQTFREFLKFFYRLEHIKSKKASIHTLEENTIDITQLSVDSRSGHHIQQIEVLDTQTGEATPRNEASPNKDVLCVFLCMQMDTIWQNLIVAGFMVVLLALFLANTFFSRTPVSKLESQLEARESAKAVETVQTDPKIAEV